MITTRHGLSLRVLGMAVAGLMLGSFTAGAYEQYSVNRDATNCRACHGDFLGAAPYVSATDGVAWVNPLTTNSVNLHDGHRTYMLSGDCGTCHGAGARFPVLISASQGGTGLPAISCLGCHGRAEPGHGGAVSGAGLRQHHYRSGVAQCGTAGCHTDADPANFTTTSEQTLPPFYFAPDAAHPNKPTNACNTGGSESAIAPPSGLDNDGDGVYDASDADCGNTGVTDETVVGFALGGAWPNPASGGLRVVFTLPDGRPAELAALDLAGRRVASREVGSMGPGRHVVDLTPGKSLAAGVYLLRLTQGGRSLTVKVALTR